MTDDAQAFAWQVVSAYELLHAGAREALPFFLRRPIERLAVELRRIEREEAPDAL